MLYLTDEESGGTELDFQISNGKKVLPLRSCGKKVLFLNFKWEKSISVEIMWEKSTRLFMLSRGKECEYQRFDAVAYVCTIFYYPCTKFMSYVTTFV